MGIEQKLTDAEKLAEAAKKAISAYAPLAGMAIEGVKWLVEKLKARGVITPEEAEAFYAQHMAEWEANNAKAQTAVDEFNALRASQKAAAGTIGAPEI